MRTWLDFVKFEHTLFSLPLLLAGALLGVGREPSWLAIVWILVAGTGARTLAMALNRIFDRAIDARNPRTADRELPAGKMTLGGAWGIAAFGLALFLLAVSQLPPLCAKLAPIPLAIFVIYPLLKRFTPLAHFGVGAALAFGPIGAYVAVTNTLEPFGAISLLATFTLFWVAGFDVIYATMDEDFDRSVGLHSIPAALGRERALAVAAGVHLLAFAALAWLTVAWLANVWAYLWLALVGVMLAVEHWQAHRVDFAFFQVNAALGFVVLALVWAGV